MSMRAVVWRAIDDSEMFGCGKPHKALGYRTQDGSMSQRQFIRPKG